VPDESTGSLFEEGQAMQKKKSVSPLAQILKDYRATYDLTQEKFANELHIDVRTLRRYENGETILTDIRELRRLATMLGVEPERMGIARLLSVPFMPEQIDEAIDRVWSLAKETRNREALALIGNLIQEADTQPHTENPVFLQRLARIYQAAGHITSITSRTATVHIALQHYQKMESIARLLNDQTLLNIALTYQGDILRRIGNIPKAITYLEAARDTTPQADTEARGNSRQLLGRAYLQANNVSGFERALRESEELAYALDPSMRSTYGFYCLGTVYEEYGKSYIKLGQTQLALDYLDRAENNLPSTKLWEIMLMTARAMVLVHGGEIKSGVNLAVEAATICHASGNNRFLERIYGIQQYLDRLTREAGQASTVLREALDGSVEY
jgi:tetratricopeptide (TPR) repeat protein